MFRFFEHIDKINKSVRKQPKIKIPSIYSKEGAQSIESTTTQSNIKESFRRTILISINDVVYRHMRDTLNFTYSSFFRSSSLLSLFDSSTSESDPKKSFIASLSSSLLWIFTFTSSSSAAFFSPFTFFV